MTGTSGCLHELCGLMDAFSLSSSPYQRALASVLAPQAGCLLKEQALIMHFGIWNAFGAKGPFSLLSSNWYVYHATSKSAKLAAAYMKAAPAGKEIHQIGDCELKQAGLKGDETARLYGDKSAILLTIDIITPRAGPNSPPTAIADNLPVLYKVSVTPATPANVQDLSMLIGALLKVTLPNVAPRAPEAPAPPPALPETVTYIAIDKIDGLTRLPFTFNIAFSFAFSKQQSASTGAPQHGTVAPPAPSAPLAVPVPSTAIPDTAAPPAAPALPPDAVPAAPNAEGEEDNGGQANADATQKQGGQQNQGGQKSTKGSTQTSTTVVDCSATSTQSPCSFSHSFQADDKEWWDISIGVSVPGVQEAKYSKGASSPPTITRHTDLYAILDLLPLAKWYSKDSFAPRLNVGLPVTGQTFYRPYFGVSENLTGRWHGFPLQLNAFAGVVYMKQSIIVPGSSPAALTQDRALKGIFGVEVPISSIVSKLKGGGKSGSTAKSGSSSSQ